MKKCKSCQSEIDDKAKKCPHCQADQRNWFSKHKILTIISIIIVFSLINGANSQKSSPTTTNTANNIVQNKETTPTVESTTDSNPHFENGTLEVNKDIQPGTYRTRQSSSGCYYTRLSGFGGSIDEIIANENSDYPAVVTISKTDKGFKSTRCGVWTQDLSQITQSKTSFGDGIFIVGTDIEPGKYKNTGSDGCYYSRLRGFGGTISDIISNENTNDQVIVSISASDKGFKSSRCGTWTKI